MWNAWTAPPGALPRDFDPWSCEAHCARCGELAQDCHCEDDDEINYARGGRDGQAPWRQGNAGSSPARVHRDDLNEDNHDIDDRTR